MIPPEIKKTSLTYKNVASISPYELFLHKYTISLQSYLDINQPNHVDHIFLIRHSY